MLIADNNEPVSEEATSSSMQGLVRRGDLYESV
jgi:hypothetical protein